MIRDSLRVALLSPCYWPEVKRGTERITRELATGLIARRHRPRLITSHPGPPTYAVEDGLPVIRMPRPPQGRLLRRRFEPYLTHVPLSYMALRMGTYDIVNAMYPADALAAARWRQRTGKPAVLSYMGVPDPVGLRERRRRLEVLLSALRGCDAVVVLSEYAAEAFSYWLGHEARVIPPGVELDIFKPSPARTSHPTIVCTAAAAEPRKNVAVLVEALKLIRREHADVRLILARTSSRDAARRAGVDVDASGVDWMDLHDRATMARVLGEAWVAVLPSHGEAFGLVMVEAMACGTPVVGYADAAIPEIINRAEIGRLFHSLDRAEVARAVLDAMELSRRAATVEHCQKRAKEFSADRTTESYIALYEELGAGRG